MKNALRFWHFALIAVSVGVITGVIGEGGFGHFMILMLLTMFGIPGIVLVAFVYGWGTANWKTGARIAAGTFCFLFPVIVISGVTGGIFHSRKVREIERYVADAVPKLDAYKAAHGRFPATLAEAGLPEPKGLLAKGYRSEGEHFSFTYTDESSMMGWVSFDGKERKWVAWD